ncbi:phage major capsid protein [Corynebacterium sp. H128]|uniref:phage major capsid protein n=1 Tax=Corynebacterium sp. H128 TaxID=3133427 RepID=UPI0030A57FBF
MLTTDKVILSPDQIESLLINPVLENSIAAQVSDTIKTDSPRVVFPRIGDIAADWVPEGEEIPLSEPTKNEVLVVPRKVASLIVTTTEGLDDSATGYFDSVGSTMVSQLINKVDEAYFTAVADPAPKGIAAVAGVTPLTGDLADLDLFAQARASIASAGFVPGFFAINPADALTLSTLKEATGSNKTLLDVDPTSQRFIVAGTQVIVSKHVPKGTGYAIPKGVSKLVVRRDAEVTADKSAFFTRDSVGIRGTMRVGFGFVDEASIVKLTFGAAA